MPLVSCHQGKLFTASLQWEAERPSCLATGLAAIDGLLPGGGLACGAVHEILSHPRQATPRFFALLLARSVSGAVVWCDPKQTLYPPAIAAAGIPAERLFLLRPRSPADQFWAIAECMRCKGVGVTIAQVPRLSRLEARRLQLAAERGGGIGLLLRPFDSNASIYAAASRWLVSPARGLRTVQRWKIQLIHAHGGRVGTTVILEHNRETDTVRAAEQLADRQGPKKTEQISA